jgi:hypothetical protein
MIKAAFVSIWFAIFGFFIYAGYRAVFEVPESVANRWEDAAAFTLVPLVIWTFVIVWAYDD